MKDYISKNKTIEANIKVHSALANSGEYNKSPHFKDENKEKVRNIILNITSKLQNKRKIIDFGCGTGFIIDQVNDLFEEVHGIDITEDMMSQIDISTGNIFLQKCYAENTPFESDTFDFATAYSFMDHLHDYKDFLKEAFRVLKSGGVLYTDLNPNRDFINSLQDIEDRNKKDVKALVQKEITGSLHNGSYYEENFGINAEVLESAEPIKTFNKGFDAQEVMESAGKIGFSKCEVEYEWYLGQGIVIHEKSPNEAKLIEAHLQSILPMSSPVFKYLRFYLWK